MEKDTCNVLNFLLDTGTPFLYTVPYEILRTGIHRDRDNPDTASHSRHLWHQSPETLQIILRGSGLAKG